MWVVGIYAEEIHGFSCCSPVIYILIFAFLCAILTFDMNICRFLTGYIGHLGYTVYDTQ